MCVAVVILCGSTAWADKRVEETSVEETALEETALEETAVGEAALGDGPVGKAAAGHASARKAAAQLDLPEDALTLLAQSLRDSCAICAEKNRKNAFSELDEFYAPGRLLTMAGDTRFEVLSDKPNELGLLGYERQSPVLTFRFHHPAARLVGVEERDETEDVWLKELASASPGDLLEGTIEVIPYPYGDGVSYLFSPSEGHLQVQCRILEISAP